MAIKFVGFAKSFPTEGCTFAFEKRNTKKEQETVTKKNLRSCNIRVG